MYLVCFFGVPVLLHSKGGGMGDGVDGGRMASKGSGGDGGI